MQYFNFNSAVLLVAVLLMAFATQGQVIDDRVQKNLNTLDFKYDIKDDGTFQFTIPVAMRTQMAFVHSSTSKYDQMEIREIYSVIYQGAQRPNEATLGTLLIDNSQKKLGAWELIYENNTYYIVFTAKVAADLDASDLKSCIDIVVTSADTMEQKLFGTDNW